MVVLFILHRYYFLLILTTINFFYNPLNLYYIFVLYDPHAKIQLRKSVDYRRLLYKNGLWAPSRHLISKSEFGHWGTHLFHITMTILTWDRRKLIQGLRRTGQRSEINGWVNLFSFERCHSLNGFTVPTNGVYHKLQVSFFLSTSKPKFEQIAPWGPRNKKTLSCQNWV